MIPPDFSVHQRVYCVLPVKKRTSALGQKQPLK
jgi:hypothetical protein